MRYHYKAKRMPIINGRISQHETSEELFLLYKENEHMEATQNQSFQKDDKLYIEVMDKFVVAKFLSVGYFT
jgi:hypothetical protein